MRLSTIVILLAAACALAAPSRFFEPSPGYTRVRDLPDSLAGKVSVLEYRIYDALEGSEAHSSVERGLYDFANKLHIETREATLKRRFPYRPGDTASVDGLREAEKHLRAEEFLADAIIEMKRLPDSTLAVKVTTYDQWSTTLGVSVGRAGGEWVGWFGPIESNLLGTGQRLGFFVSHDLERDSRYLTYSNTAFTPWRLKADAQYFWNSDGYSYAFTGGLPLRTRGQRWGFSFSATGYEASETHYLSGNELDRLDEEGRLDSADARFFGRTNVLWQWQGVRSQSLSLGVTRSYGRALKVSVTPFYLRNARELIPGKGIGYGISGTLYDDLGYARDTANAPIAPTYDARHDEVLGATLSLYRYAYKTVSNYRNLKWSETLETGWRLSASAGQNQEWLGAENARPYFSYAAVYNDAWRDALFFTSSASLKHFVAESGEPANGTSAAAAEAQWKPYPLLSTVLSAQYDRIFANPDARNLYLGEESGLLGYPNFYYAGRARLLASAEQRFFPPWEYGTVAPAFAAFVNAGNAWDGGGPPDKLHFAAGVGLRLGATRSVQKVVNHLNLTWPIGEKHLNGPIFGIRAAKSL